MGPADDNPRDEKILKVLLCVCFCFNFRCIHAPCSSFSSSFQEQAGWVVGLHNDVAFRVPPSPMHRSMRQVSLVQLTSLFRIAKEVESSVYLLLDCKQVIRT